MTLSARLLSVCLLVVSCLGLPAWAADMVSVRNPSVNLREAPDTDSQVLWKLSKGYPLQVLQRQGDWLKVRDYEGDQGWIARHATLSRPHHIVKAKTANVRAADNEQSEVIKKVERGQVLRTLKKSRGWVQVELPRGQGTGWVAGYLLWGW